MAIVKPFKAVRTTGDKIARVSSKSHNIYTPEVLDSKLANNPYSFLHVTTPIYKSATEERSKTERFQLLQKQYANFKEQKVLTQDEIPAFYIYKKTTTSDSFCGIIAATSVEDCVNNRIKKHEGTLKQREILFENYLQNTGFNAEPVLLTYPDNTQISNILKKYSQHNPTYEFATANKDEHVLWVVTDTTDIGEITNIFQEIDTLYIADGHHRSSASCLMAERLKKENPKHTGNEPYNFFMSYLLAESALNIYEFNRFITDLNGLSIQEFLEALKDVFTIEKYDQEFYKPLKKHTFSMYLDGAFYALHLRQETYSFTNVLSKLDAQILYSAVLKPILGIENIRDDSKIMYSQNKSNGLELKTKVDAGTFKVSFGMNATDISELKEIVDAGLLMPPKTTYIEPKLRSALTIYEF
jgi:uncharacterized protein (DUF1015 family)